MSRTVLSKYLIKIKSGFSETISKKDLLLRNDPGERPTIKRSDIGFLTTDFQRRFEAG
jgi:hypothetical protein